jgi:hypothetical protein
MHYAQCVPSATNPDSDGDGIADVCDYDDDNDGILDTVECPTVNNKPLFHLFDYTPSNLADPLWLYKQTNGIASAYVCASGTGCSTAPNGQPYANVNVTGTVDNLAYDDGKYYTVNSAGNLLYSANIITGNFINLGNANIGSGYKNLGYDNGVFYHWKRIGSTNNIELFSTTNPVSVSWTSLGTIVGGTYTFGSGGFNYLLKDIAVNDGIFYFLYDGTDVPTDESYSSVRSIVYSNNSPTTAASSWQNLGSANFGVDVYNIAYGSEDVLTLCDTDDDGIPNHLDLDSDNDGCPDAIEGGASFTSANLVNSSMPGGNTGAASGTFNQPITQNLGNTVNTTSSSTRYGVPTVAVSGQTLGTSQTANPVLAAGTAGANQTITSGSTPTALSLTGATGSIQWQVSTDNITFTNISGATNATYAPGSLTATRYYRAIVTSVGGCTAISNTVTINVNNPCLISATNPDSDGDGIADACDYDDDNDGITDSAENICATSSKIEGTPVFENTFGTGAPTTDPYVINHTFQAISPFDGEYSVTTSGSQAIVQWKTDLTGNKDAGNPIITDGTTTGRYLGININSPANINKAIYRVSNLNVVSGREYRARLDIAGLANGSGDIPQLKISIIGTSSGNVLASADTSTLGIANDDVWRRLQLNFTPTENNVTLEIINLQPNGSFGNDVGIDNIILAPLFCDLDGDGIPNQLDLDSDNDGCPDAIEGGASFTSSNLVNSSMPGGNVGATSGTYNQPITQNLGNTVNTTLTSANYGVPTVAGSGQTIGTSQTANPVLIAGTASTNQTIATGSTPTALALTGATGSIQWQVSTDNTTFNNISGATGTTYAPGALTATRYYRAIVTSAGGCTAISNTVTINVVPPYDCTGKIYSLSSVTGEIRVFNTPNSSGVLGAVMNTTPHPTAISPAPNGPNALGYSNATRKFYYVLNQNNGTGNTFVSYDPITNIYQTLAGTTGYIYRGTVTNDGLGYYGLTSSNELKYYNITNNTWTSITDYYVDQNGNDLFTILNTYSGGDIAIDGNGDLWILAGTNSSPTTFLFRAKGPLPKTDLGAVPMVLEQIAQQNIGAGSSGIAFNSVGELFITNSANLYKMNNNFTISLIGNLSPSNGGGDLASCAFPLNPYSISDFGDAPDSYGTLLTSNGPRHTALQYNATNNTSTLMIGSTVDLENDGFPNGNSDGDDNNNLNDENSVTMPVLNSTATTYSVNVPLVNTTGATGTLRGWIDFNKNGVFEASEAASVSVPNGSTTATLSWAGLSGLSGGDTYYRLRIAKNNSDIAQPTGLASGGEVEDGKISISGPAVCYRDPINNGTGSETKMGITLLKRAGSNDPDNWPMVRKSGHIALESNTQGFVVTRMAKADLGNITNPQEGMMVYDTTDKCLKIYSDNAWKCFSTPACP